MDAHVAAIRASVRDKVRKSDDPAGAALATELERQTAAPNTQPGHSHTGLSQMF